MILALPYCTNDFPLAQRLMLWLEELDQYPNHDLRLFREATSPVIAPRGVWRSVETHTFKNPYQSFPGQKGWAMGTTQAFSSVARHIEYNEAQPFLFLEPDCVPIKKGWLDELETEYARTKKPFMGFLVPQQSDSPAHMSGIGVYPGKVVEHAGQALMLDEQWPWDLAAGQYILPKAHFTDLISHKWKRAPYTSLSEFYAENSRETVLFHSQKTDALIKLLQQQNGGGHEKENEEKGNEKRREERVLTQSAAKVPAPPAPNYPDDGIPLSTPWKSLSKKEQKLRRQGQAARARAAKLAKKRGDEKCKPTSMTRTGILSPSSLDTLDSSGAEKVQPSSAPLIPNTTTVIPAPLGSFTSETSTCRADLAKFCVGLGLDIGFGGDPIVPTALTFDMPNPYTRVGMAKQIFRGSARNLSFFCDESLDYIFSSHLLEDFDYEDLIQMIKEWRRVLKMGGLLISNCPDQQKFLAHCKATGQPLNMAHKEQDFSLETFSEKVIAFTGAWKLVYKKEEHGPYSWLSVYKKV